MSLFSPGTVDSSHFKKNPEYIQQRRMIIREFHPDRGGDPEVFIQQLHQLDTTWTQRTPGFTSLPDLPQFSTIFTAAPFYSSVNTFLEDNQKHLDTLRDKASSASSHFLTYHKRGKHIVEEIVEHSAEVISTQVRHFKKRY